MLAVRLSAWEKSQIRFWRCGLKAGVGRASRGASASSAVSLGILHPIAFRHRSSASIAANPGTGRRIAQRGGGIWPLLPLPLAFVGCTLSNQSLDPLGYNIPLVSLLGPERLHPPVLVTAVVEVHQQKVTYLGGQIITVSIDTLARVLLEVLKRLIRCRHPCRGLQKAFFPEGKRLQRRTCWFRAYSVTLALLRDQRAMAGGPRHCQYIHRS